MEVLAGALPSDRAAWWKNVSEGAGLGVARIAMRCLGAGALAGEMSLRRGGAILALSLGEGTADVVVVEEGKVAFARSVAVGRPLEGEGEDVSGYAERVSVECKRTWMSHRGARTAIALEGVVVVGEGTLCERVAGVCGVGLGVVGEVLGRAGMVGVPDAMPEGVRSSAAGLLGLLVEVAQGRVSLDFEHPRRARERGGRKRQMSLAGLMGVLLLGGLGYVGADQALGGKREELAGLMAQEKQLRKEVDVFLREQARVKHIQHWKASRADWISHVRFISAGMPGAEAARLEEVSGTATGEALFTPKGTFPRGAWSEKRGVALDLKGKVESRPVGAQWREDLLNSGEYEVQMQGADTQDRFGVTLRTGAARPGVVTKVRETTQKTGEKGATP